MKWHRKPIRPARGIKDEVAGVGLAAIEVYSE